MSDNPFSDAPAIAKWELWSVAQMLVTTHGEDAEAHAQSRLDDALAQGDESAEIVWSGILTQIRKIKGEQQG